MFCIVPEPIIVGLDGVLKSVLQDVERMLRGAIATHIMKTLAVLELFLIAFGTHAQNGPTLKNFHLARRSIETCDQAGGAGNRTATN
jgi:hypothetical protein